MTRTIWKNVLLIAILVLFAEETVAQNTSDQLHHNILYVTVRVRALNSVGSGVIFSSILRGGQFETYVLTNFHVVSDAVVINEEWDTFEKRMIKKENRKTIEVEQFKFQNLSEPTGTLLLQADIIDWNSAHDLALLKLRSNDEFRVAKKISAENIRTIKIFEPVWVCGAGLGRPPFPTFGHIASVNDELDNISYWMVSAPAIFGNSGGGTFLASTMEFIGIPSRVAVAMTGWSPNAVYHMNYIIPVRRIYDWLNSIGWQELYDPTGKKRDEWLLERGKR